MLTFKVRSSSGEDAYEIAAERLGARLRFACSCAAASAGQMCKHRLALAAGDADGVILGAEQLAALKALVAGSDFEASLNELSALEAQAAKIKAQIAAEKKRLARLAQG